MSNPQILMAGDSTMAAYPPKDQPMTGWGAVLEKQTLAQVKVLNYAQPGTRLDQCRNGVWKTLLEKCSKGDLVIIQFGHNDQKLADPYWTKPPLSREESLARYKRHLTDCITEAKAKGAEVLLCSSIARLTVDKEGKLKDFYRLSDYCECAEKTAQEQKCLFIDMQKIFFREIGKVTPKAAEKWYMVSVNGKDRTHLNPEGAEMAAKWFTEELFRLFPDTAKRFFNR